MLASFSNRPTKGRSFCWLLFRICILTQADVFFFSVSSVLLNIVLVPYQPAGMDWNLVEFHPYKGQFHSWRATRVLIKFGQESRETSISLFYFLLVKSLNSRPYLNPGPHALLLDFCAALRTKFVPGANFAATGWALIFCFQLGTTFRTEF